MDLALRQPIASVDRQYLISVVTADGSRITDPCQLNRCNDFHRFGNRRRG